MIDWLLGFAAGIFVMDVFWFLILRRGGKERLQNLNSMAAQAREILVSANKAHDDVMALRKVIEG